MGAGIHQHLLEQGNKSSVEMQITVEAYTGAILGVLNWWIENDMQVDQEIIYNKLINMNIFPEYLFKNES